MIATTDPRPLTDYPIAARGLVRRFGDLVAVDGVDLTVNQGEVYGFLGPNGAGKSTTVRMLTTLLRPSEGTAMVAGHDIVKEPAKVRRSIGVALQDAAIDPIMSGRELLDLQAVLFGLPRKASKVRRDELLERVGLTDAADRRVGEYSGGMRRRLDLAMSLIHEPPVLFLDEPTTGLDPLSRVGLWDEVRRLNTEVGTTVLLTTQYLEEADQLAHRIGIIDGGKLVTEGSPAALKAAVGDPTLRFDVDSSHMDAAARVLEAFGPTRPARTGRVAIGLVGGASKLTEVIRALDEAEVEVEHMELDAPSLDDVFANATGRRLEGAADGDPSATPDPGGSSR